MCLEIACYVVRQVRNQQVSNTTKTSPFDQISENSVIMPANHELNCCKFKEPDHCRGFLRDATGVE